VAADALEQTLRDLPNRGTLVKDRGYRQVWRFEVEGKAYYLKFYPRGGSVWSRDWWRRRFRGSPAAREFYRLQWLQKAKVPAPRAVAYLGGFTLAGAKGDAVILHAIEPSVTLDQLLNEQALAGNYPPAQRRRLADQLIELVHQLGAAGYGHDDLHLGNFLLHDGKLFLIDAYAVRKGGLRTADVLLLGASVSRFAATTDLVRGWRRLVGESPLPPTNTTSAGIWQSQLDRINGDNRYFGRIAVGEWAGVFFRTTKYPRRWSNVSRLDVTPQEWEVALPALLEQIGPGAAAGDGRPAGPAAAGKPMKAGPSGDVYAATVNLGGQDVDVVVKRPRRRYWYRYLNEVGRGARARRAWRKAWHLVVRDLPTAWPVAFFERRRLGYVVDTFLVTERVHGPTLWNVDLDALTPRSREMLFRRTGRLLRLLERYGFGHFDAKASNWIVRPDPELGPGPVLIDVDGVRHRRWPGLGVRRLLRSLAERKQYGRADSLALCLGYAPFARLDVEGPPEAEAPDSPPASEGPTDSKGTGVLADEPDVGPNGPTT
jgi:tRNA A-37 threonylcarbamoyl transferase component Bud32